MAAGVGESGSPAPKPATSSPAAWRALALASTASVADSVMASTRREMRLMPPMVARPIAAVPIVLASLRRRMDGQSDAKRRADGSGVGLLGGEVGEVEQAGVVGEDL